MLLITLGKRANREGRSTMLRMAKHLRLSLAGPVAPAVLCWFLFSQPHAAASDIVPDEDFFARQVQERYVAPFRSGDIAAWGQAFAEDAIALHNFREADRGRAAIVAFGEAVHQMFDLAQYDVQVTDVRRGADWAYTAGSYTSLLVSKQDGSEPFGLQRGKFVLLWERSDGGKWLIVLDMGNSSE